MEKYTSLISPIYMQDQIGNEKKSNINLTQALSADLTLLYRRYLHIWYIFLCYVYQFYGKMILAETIFDDNIDFT